MSLVNSQFTWTTAARPIFAAVTVGCDRSAAPKTQSVSKTTAKQADPDLQPPAGNTEPDDRPNGQDTPVGNANRTRRPGRCGQARTGRSSRCG